MTQALDEVPEATDVVFRRYPQLYGSVDDYYDDFSSTGLLGVIEFGGAFTSPSSLIHEPSPRPVVYQSIKYYVNEILIPGVLGFGALGNALCLALIINRASRCPRSCFCSSPESKPRPWSSSGTSLPTAGRSRVSGGGPVKLQPLERSALVGLGALAISDLLFCLVGLPAVWLKSSSSMSPTDGASVTAKLAFYHKVYKHPLQNMFVFSSTWIAVAIAVERFIAVGSPIRARWFLKARYSVFAAILIFFAAALVTGPLIFRFQFRTINCSTPLTECHLLIPEPTYLFQNAQFRTTYYAISSTLGTFLPLVLLIVSSCGLVGVLYRTRVAGITSPERYPCTRVTATVTAVVVSFVILVCPSTVCQAIIDLSPGNSQHLGQAYLVAINISNLAQALWFGANFLLYCGCANIRRRFFPKRTTMSTTLGGATVTCQLAMRSGQSCHSDSGTPCSRSPLRGGTVGGSRLDVASYDGHSECELPCDLVTSTVCPLAQTAVGSIDRGGSQAGYDVIIGREGVERGLTRIHVQFFDDDVKKLVDVEDV